MSASRSRSTPAAVRRSAKSSGFCRNGDSYSPGFQRAPATMRAPVVVLFGQLTDGGAGQRRRGGWVAHRAGIDADADHRDDRGEGQAEVRLSVSVGRVNVVPAEIGPGMEMVITPEASETLGVPEP